MSNHPSRRRIGHRVAAFLLFCACAAIAAAQAPDDIPEPIRKLAPLAGFWRAERVEFLDESGEIRRVSSAVSCNRLLLDGRAMHHIGRLDEPRILGHTWYFYDPIGKTLRSSSVSSRGQYDEFVGDWRDGELTLTLKPGPYYGDRRFRLVYFDIGVDRFRERLELSEDDGETWRVVSRQTFARITDFSAAAGLCD